MQKGLGDGLFSGETFQSDGGDFTLQSGQNFRVVEDH